MKSSDWAYFAGLFDGEGSVTVSHVKRKTDAASGKAGTHLFNYSLRISNNDPSPLNELQTKLGGSVRSHSKAKANSFVWIAQGEVAVSFAIGILPFTRIKTSQLEKFLTLMKLRNKTGQRITWQQRKSRIKVINEIKETEFRRGAVGLRLLGDVA